MRFFALFLTGFLLLRGALEAQVYEVIAPSVLTPPTGENTRISEKELSAYQEIFFKDALPYSPSVTFVSSGPTGQLTDLYIRGARTLHNLVLVDDIYVNNPAVGGSVDLSQFLNGDMESIDVFPGPHSLAYGPGALGGTVVLTPKRGKGKPSIKAHGEGGSFKTRYGFMTAQGEADRFHFATTLAGFGRGASSFTNPLHGNYQSDRYLNETVTSRLGYALTENWDIEGLIRYTEGRVQFNEIQTIGTSSLPVEAENFSDTKMLMASLENRWGGERWDHSVKATYFRNNLETTGIGFPNRGTTGSHPLLIYRTEGRLNSHLTLLGGFEGGQEQALDITPYTRHLYTRQHGGIYVISLLKPLDALTLKAGIRGDSYQHVGQGVTYNLSAAYALRPTTCLRLGYGTNFRPPVLSDLFQHSPQSIPNPLLRSETGQSGELGLDQAIWGERLKLNLTGFVNRIDQIALSRPVSPGIFQRYNGARRMTQGVELSLPWKTLKTLEMKPMLTFTRSRDFPGNVASPLIPRFKGAVQMKWQVKPDLSFFIQATGVSARKDSLSLQNLAPYGVINLGSSYDLTSRLAFFWRVENVGNRRYEEIYGYGMRGTGFFCGLEAKTNDEK